MFTIKTPTTHDNFKAYYALRHKVLSEPWGDPKGTEKDDYEPITVTRDKPFEKVIGYAADLLYPPGKQTFSHKKVNDTIKLEDDPETYKIVAITRNEVVLSADSNKRRTIIKANATTASLK